MTSRAFSPLGLSILLFSTVHLPAEDWQKKLAENNSNKVVLDLIDSKAGELARYIRELSNHSSCKTEFDPPALANMLVGRYRYNGTSALDAFTELSKSSGLQIAYTETGLIFSLGSQSWKASDGRVIEATFIKQEGEALVIERNGQQFQVPFEKLSSESVTLAKKLAQATRTAPPRAVPTQSLLPERLSIKSLQLLPDGSALLAGDNVPEDKRSIMYLGTSSGKEWKKLDFKGKLWSDCVAAPSDARALAATMGIDDVPRVCFSKNGGNIWQIACPKIIEVDGKKLEILRPFWPSQGLERLILATSPPGFCEWDIASQKAIFLSPGSERITDYQFSAGAHFIRLGFAEPMQCLKSTDDAKNWTPISPDTTPWRLIAKASLLLDGFSENKIGNHGIMWAVEIEGTAFCHLARRSSRSASDRVPSVFFSTNQGDAWEPAPVDRRTADIKTLFAGSPLVRQSTTGATLISPGQQLELRYDSANKCVYASAGTEWFVIQLPTGTWQRINELPEP